MKPLLHSTDDASRLNGVARRSHIWNMLTPRALPDGRLRGLCATRGFTTGAWAMRRLAQPGTSGPQRAGLLSVLAFLCLGTTTSFGQSSPFAGEWMLEITQGRTVQTGLLAIEETDDGLVGFVENGPIALAIEGDRISMAIDSSNASGYPLERHLEGVLTGTRMSGEFGPPADAPEEELLVCRRFPGGCVHPSGTWEAVPYVEALPETDVPAPFDLSGLWGGTAGGGMSKWSSSLTAQGQAWKDEFRVDLDLPALRCASRGIFSAQRSAPEVFQEEHKITFVSGGVGGNRVRYIYMDGREPPEFFPSSAMGFSRGQWEGDHLIVETTLLSAGVRGFMGEMYSENSRMLERFWLNEDGILSSVMEFHDPENFARPLLQRTRWARQSPDTVPIPAVCDVDSFFRQIYVDELMEEYIDRSDRRF